MVSYKICKAAIQALTKTVKQKKQLSIYEDKNKPTDTLDDLCFFSLDEMKNVFGLIENKDDYEMLEILENEKVTNDKTIGFDIGYIAETSFQRLRTQQSNQCGIHQTLTIWTT
jgi:hypothetical protein